MKIPNEVHRGRSWRIHSLVDGFTLEDTWRFPVEGCEEDFPAVVRMIAASDPAESASLPTRFLWKTRDRLGQWFGLGRISTRASAIHSGSLRDSLPDDLRGSADGCRFDHLPFDSLYWTDDEFAAELSNRTVHGVMHLGWVRVEGDRYRPEMAVYVKPRGGFGRAYMAFIKPFRYLIVYPALERQMSRVWNARAEEFKQHRP